MARTRIQWHKGHHNYKLSSDEIEELKSRYPQNGGRDFKNYVAALKDDVMLRDIVAKIDKKRICPAEFILEMNNFSERIKTHLAAFNGNHRDSFPFYVSKAALFYAHQMPISFTLIAMRREQSTLILKKLKCKLYENGEKKVTIPKKGEFRYPDMPDYQAKLDCVQFCADIEHFLFFGQTGKSGLPFHVEEKFVLREGAGKNASDELIEAYIKGHMEELLRWIKRTGSERDATDLVRKRKEGIRE